MFKQIKNPKTIAFAVALGVYGLASFDRRLKSKTPAKRIGATSWIYYPGCGFGPAPNENASAVKALGKLDANVESSIDAKSSPTTPVNTRTLPLIYYPGCGFGPTPKS